MTESDARLAELVDRVETLERELAARDERVERLETYARNLEDRVAELEARVESHDDRLQSQSDRLQSQSDRLQSHDDRLHSHDADLESLETRTTTAESKTEAALNKAEANKRRVRELQSRELEKGAHLRSDHVDPAETATPQGRLEQITKDDGHTYYRLPETDDPLDRHARTTLAHGDLLPVQQLARLDADLRRSCTNALPTRLAAKLWQARTDPAVDDDPWTRGCKSVREYVTASDLKHWIRRQEEGISETYAKKLVSRTIDAILDLSRHRLAVRKRSQRKNGLEYTERRLVLPADAEIPGETTGSSDSSSTATASSSDSSPPANASSSESTNTAARSDSSAIDERDTDEPPETADVLG